MRTHFFFSKSPVLAHRSLPWWRRMRSRRSWRVLGRAEVDEEGRVVPPDPPLTPSSAVKTNAAAAEAPPDVTKVDMATSPICPCPSPELIRRQHRHLPNRYQQQSAFYPKIYRRISGIFVAAFFAFVVACLDSSKYRFDSSRFAASTGHHFSIFY